MPLDGSESYANGFDPPPRYCHPRTMIKRVFPGQNGCQVLLPGMGGHYLQHYYPPQRVSNSKVSITVK
jgi:hypothetical protein